MKNALRNCCLKYLPSLAVHEFEAEGFGALTEAPEDARPLLGIVRVSARIAIDDLSFQGAVQQNGEFPCGGRDRLSFADASSQPTIEGAEPRLGTAQTSLFRFSV